MHPRKAIRDAVQARLSGATAAGTRVEKTRTVPHQRLQLPAIAIYTLSENVSPESKSTAPLRLSRDLELAIEICAQTKPDSDVDDVLDALCLQVERAMHADETLGHTAQFSFLVSTDIEVVELGANRLALARLVYNVTYETLAPDPDDVAADDFSTADIKYSLNGTQAAADQRHDQLTNLED